MITKIIENSSKKQFRIQINIRLYPSSFELLINLVFFFYLQPEKVQFDGKNYFQSTPGLDFQSIDNKVT